MEDAERRIESLQRQLGDLESVFETLSHVEQKISTTEQSLEGLNRALKSRIHRGHDKTVMSRDLRDSAVESEVLQQVATRLGEEVATRGLDALIIRADDALREEKWIQLRRAIEFVYWAWGLLCLRFCLFLISVLPCLSERLGFLALKSSIVQTSTQAVDVRGVK